LGGIIMGIIDGIITLQVGILAWGWAYLTILIMDLDTTLAGVIPISTTPSIILDGEAHITMIGAIVHFMAHTTHILEDTIHTLEIIIHFITP
jgi:hypothetical protein